MIYNVCLQTSESNIVFSGYGVSWDYWVDGEHLVPEYWETSSGDIIPISSELWSSYIPSLTTLTNERCVRLLHKESDMRHFLNAKDCDIISKAICEKNRVVF